MEENKVFEEERTEELEREDSLNELREMSNEEEEEKKKVSKRKSDAGWGFLGAAAAVTLYVGAKAVWNFGKKQWDKRKQRKKSEPIDVEFEEVILEEYPDEESEKTEEKPEEKKDSKKRK